MTKTRLLYIDDEKINLLAFRAQFRRWFEVFCAHSAESAREILAQQSIDFVFSDQRMPQVSGTELLDWVRNQQPGARRVIISGFIEDTRIQEGLRNGLVQAAIEKPYRVPEIIRFIEENQQPEDES
ncbi:response regulator [Spirochaeta dissipatitropha]